MKGFIKFEKGLFGGEECTENCNCLEDGWEKKNAEYCALLGDCGPSKNWLGQDGYNKGYKVTTGKAKDKKD